MDERWIRGISVSGGAIGSLLAMTTILRVVGSHDTGLLVTFVALGSASFAIALQDWLRTRYSGHRD